MKRLVTADNLMTATLWQAVLESAGIRCQLRNRYISGAVGELPTDQVAPQLWLFNDNDSARAEQLLDELRRAPDSPPWTCPACNEILEGQFFQCWHCGATRAPLP